MSYKARVFKTAVAWHGFVWLEQLNILAKTGEKYYQELNIALFLAVPSKAIILDFNFF